MSKYTEKHLPQIEYFYDGYIYPFIGNADLKTLIKWRTDKINSDSLSLYNKEARNTYLEHLECIEQCIKILLSNPNPDFSIDMLAKQQEERVLKELKTQERAIDFLSDLTAQDREELLKTVEKFFK